MSIIFDALKKAQMKLNAQRSKNSDEHKHPAPSPTPTPASPPTSPLKFSANEDLTQPIKPIPGARPIDKPKIAEEKKSTLGTKKERTWSIHDVRHINPFAFILLILIGLLGSALVFYIFNYKLKDKYIIQAPIKDSTSGSGKAKAGTRRNIFFLSPEISLSLEGILSSDGENLALIDDGIVKVGDTIKGAEVIAIGTDEVTLSYSGKEIILKLK